MKYLRNYNTKTRKHRKNGGGHCSSAMCNNDDNNDNNDTPDEAPIEEIRMYELLNNANRATITSARIFGVSHLPKEINRLTGVLTLEIYNCTFNSVPDTIGQLTTLTKLILAETKITRVPSTIGNLTNLTFLDLDNNQLISLPKEIGQLINLKTLAANNNRLSRLPEEICQLTKLEKLLLESNILTSLPNEIGKLTNLRELALSGNQLSRVPATFSNLINLSRLTVENNPWKYPINIGKLTTLIGHYRNIINDINNRIWQEEPRKQAEMVSLLNSLSQPLTIQNNTSSNSVPKGYVSKKDRNQVTLPQDMLREVASYLGWNFLPKQKYRNPTYYTRDILRPVIYNSIYERRKKELNENLPESVDLNNTENALKRMQDIDERKTKTSLRSLIGGRRRTRRRNKK